MNRDPIVDRLNDLKPEFSVVKSAVSGGVDLRYFDAVADQTYSTELVPPGGIGDVTLETLMNEAAMSITVLWLKNASIYKDKGVIRV